MKMFIYASLIPLMLAAAACEDKPAYDPPKEVELSVSKTDITFDRFGGEQTITVTSASQPGISSNVDWCSTQAAKINRNKETVVTVMAGANRTASAKNGVITISCNGKKISVNVTTQAGTPPEVAKTTALTPEIVFNTIKLGWNMGNQMDAIGGDGVASETVWGNPMCTQATMDGLKAAGFSAVRICTSWEGHIGEAPLYKIDEAWFSRVETIVNYAEKAGLVAILNTHHDENYWLNIAQAYPNPAKNEQIKDKIFNFWLQVAKRFQGKGEWLIFESFNEIQDGGWGWSDAFKANPAAQYKILNDWNQVFVDAVRCTGGNNATRWLGIPGYAANPGFTMKGLVLPQDYTDANRLMVAVHDYDPYNYTLRDPLVRRFGHTAERSLRCDNDDEAGLRNTFDQLKAAYIDKGIPVYLGEMGCSRHEKEDLPYQKYYIEYFCKAAADHMLPMLVWDNGAKGTGPERHPYIDHGTGRIVDDTARDLIQTMLKAVTSKDASYTLDSVYNSAP